MLNIGNKKYRNMQEQVGWNSERIDKILEFLDGVNLSDNVVIINDMSQILTPEELEVVNKTVSFLVYDGSLYIKKSQDASEAKFDIIFTISGSSVISFNSKEIIVTLSNGALGIIAAAYSVYSVSQIDALLSAKASISYVDEQLALKASLSGANFTGAITAPSIIQDMVGYSFGKMTLPAATLEYVFAGAVINGNKLTLVLAFNLTRTSDFTGAAPIGSFYIPTAVLDKIFPTVIGGYSTLVNMGEVTITSDAVTTKKVSYQITKGSTSLTYYLTGSGNLNTQFTLNTKYFVRIEATFLLSNNLAE